MTPHAVLRPATPGDVDVLADILVEGFETYRPFAPEGWAPPGRLELALGMTPKFRDEDWWCVVAEVEGAIAGTVAFMSPVRHSRPSDEPGLAHLLNLFVRPPHWGTGLARTLHAGTIAEAAGRGYTSIRLFTPAGQARARRFYEREGWSQAGAPFAEEHIGGLEIVEYRRPLP